MPRIKSAKKAMRQARARFTHNRAQRSATPSPAPILPQAGDGDEEGVKTLKCKECGTMNLPTEWYCESCGGELATL